MVVQKLAKCPEREGASMAAVLLGNNINTTEKWIRKWANVINTSYRRGPSIPSILATDERDD